MSSNHSVKSKEATAPAHFDVVTKCNALSTLWLQQAFACARHQHCTATRRIPLKYSVCHGPEDNGPYKPAAGRAHHQSVVAMCIRAVCSEVDTRKRGARIGSRVALELLILLMLKPVISTTSRAAFAARNTTRQRTHGTINATGGGVVV